MTIQTSITDLKAGREMDRLVGERLFGYHVYYYSKGRPSYWTLLDGEERRVTIQRGLLIGERDTEALAWNDAPHFSTEIADAWEVFRAGLERFGWADIHMDMENYGREPGDIATVEIGEWVAFGDVCEAICRAVLLALDGART